MVLQKKTSQRFFCHNNSEIFLRSPNVEKGPFQDLKMHLCTEISLRPGHRGLGLGYYYLVCKQLWNLMVWLVKFNRHLDPNKPSKNIFDIISDDWSEYRVFLEFEVFFGPIINNLPETNLWLGEQLLLTTFSISIIL